MLLDFSFIIIRVSAEAAAKRLILRANAAQQRHNIRFVQVDGHFEGGLAVTAGRRVGGMRQNITTQNQ
jgi:hypothetical protein